MRDGATVLSLAVLLVVAGTAASLAQEQPTTTESADLDLREANVVGVEFEVADEAAGRYDFDVTLFHDDDGESGYADRWQVETLNGTELGRRELLHAHGTQPFTRSERIAVPENVSLVVVRGHDQTHGFGGQAMVVDLRTSASEAIQQGSAARDFGECAVVQRTAGNRTTTAATTAGTATADAADANLVDCPWEANATTTA